VAKPKKIPAPNQAAAQPVQVEKPGLKWKVIAQIAGAFAILWITAAMTTPYISYWGVGVVGVLTLVAAGFGIYIWRLTQKTSAIAQILQGATDADGRKAALEKLASGDAKDALNALATAQIQAQEDPDKAIATLVAIDVEKAPATVQDEIRSMLALLYLAVNKPREARPVADKIRLDRQANAKAKAMAAAVIAESFARTGKPEEARVLLDTYKADDPTLAELRPALLRAQVWTYFALTKRGLARKAMDGLVALDPNHLGPFMDPKASPELQKLALSALEAGGYQMRPKTKMRMSR
jgi:hypothetical protein